LPAAPKPTKEPKKTWVLIASTAITILLFVLLVVFAGALRDADSLYQARYVVLVACAAVLAQVLFLFKKESTADVGVKRVGLSIKLGGPAAVAALVVVGSYWLIPRSYSPPPQGVIGYVVHGPDSFEEAVKAVVVGVYGGSSVVTSDSGEFSMKPIVVQNQPKNAGDAITFNVDGWVIRDPYIGVRGRMYLPKPGAEPIRIRVLRRGDRLFLAGASIEKILGQRTFQFDAGARPPRGSQRSPTVQAQARQEWDAFLAGPAREVGFPLDQLKNAVHIWILTANTSYQKGLAALYYNNFDEARVYFQQAAKQVQGDLYVTVGAAYTEYRRGNYTESARLLNALSAKDPLLQKNLYIVTHPGEPAGDSNDGPATEKQPSPTPVPTRPQTTPTVTPMDRDEQMVAKTQNIVNLMRTDQFEAIRAMYDESMPANLTAQTLRDNWNDKVHNFGSFLRILTAEKDTDQNVVVVMCQFTNGQVRVEVRYDLSLTKITGLYVRPATQPRGLSK
jgi:hypothetical protein